MQVNNKFTMTIPARSSNESFARACISAFAAQLDPTIEEINDILYVNPGSVSIPKENTKRGYVILTDEKIVHKSLDGEILEEYIL